MRICGRVECVHVKNRREAVDEVRSGDVLAALILPSDLVEQINSLSSLNPGTPRVEVIVNEENPIKAQLVNERIESLLAQANLLIARRIAVEGGHYLNLLINGGGFNVLGQTFHILGLRSSAQILAALEPALPRGALRELARCRSPTSPTWPAKTSTSPDPLIDRIAQPIEVDKQVVSGATPPLEVFAIAVAATLTLTFVTVCWWPARSPLEREENAFSRLTRGLISPLQLLGAKVAAGDRRRPGGHPVDARRAAGLRAPALEPLRPLAGRDTRPAAGRWARPGRRWAPRRARSAPSPCSPSWSRCRSPSFR